MDASIGMTNGIALSNLCCVTAMEKPFRSKNKKEKYPVSDHTVVNLAAT